MVWPHCQLLTPHPGPGGGGVVYSFWDSLMNEYLCEWINPLPSPSPPDLRPQPRVVNFQSNLTCRSEKRRWWTISHQHLEFRCLQVQEGSAEALLEGAGFTAKQVKNWSPFPEGRCCWQMEKDPITSSSTDVMVRGCHWCARVSLIQRMIVLIQIILHPEDDPTGV